MKYVSVCDNDLHFNSTLYVLDHTLIHLGLWWLYNFSMHPAHLV